MCGIVGYVGERSAREIILAGLEKLEYRGYDSAGSSLVAGRTARGRPRRRQPEPPARGRRGATTSDAGGGVAVAAPPATTGIGHTRWATHGRVTEENAHPHYDTEDRVHVVVNGIVENYLELKQRLMADGAVFTSETDAEVIAHLISEQPGRTATSSEAVRRRLRRAARPLRVRRRRRPTSPACSSPPARSARWSSAAATASSSSPRRSPRSSPTRATSS